MARARVVFRILVGLTLAVMIAGRLGGGHLPRPLWPFIRWFAVSAYVFGAYGLVAVAQALRDSGNRRAWLTDVLIAAAWIPYWVTNLPRVPQLFL